MTSASLACPKSAPVVAARDFKKGMVITRDGLPWIVEDCHTQKMAQRWLVLHVKLRQIKTRHVVE